MTDVLNAVLLLSPTLCGLTSWATGTHIAITHSQHCVGYWLAAVTNRLVQHNVGDSSKTAFKTM